MHPNPEPNHPEADHLPAIANRPAGAITQVTATSLPSPVPDVTSLLRALRRRWVLAAALGMLCGGIAAGLAYAMIQPAKYKAQAMLQVASYNPRILVDTADARADFRTYQKTQEAQIKSRRVISTALRDPEVATLKSVLKQSDPIEWLQKEIQVDYANGSEILRIGFSGQDARDATLLTNAVTRAYLAEVVGVEEKSRRERYNMLNEIWHKYQQRLKDKRGELKTLAEAAGSSDKQALAIVHQSEHERLARAEAELARIQTEMRTLQVESKVLRKESELAAERPASSATVESLIDQNAQMIALRDRAAQAQRSIAQVTRVSVSNSDPAVTRPREDLADCKLAMTALHAKLVPIYQKQLTSDAGAEPEMKISLLEERIKILGDLEAAIKGDVERLSSRSRQITRASLDQDSIHDEIAAADTLAKRLGAEVEVMNVELQAPPRISMFEFAEQPGSKDEMKRIKIAGIAGMGALVMAVAGVSLIEWRMRRIDSSTELGPTLGMRVIGTLPEAPSRVRLGTHESDHTRRWLSIMIESVDAARTTLLHASRGESIQLVMIASAVGGEGKTSLSAHLSSSLARAGRRTLLVDCDLRRPTAHRLFDVEQGPGMSEVLRGESTLEETIVATQTPYLSILPAGACDIGAIHALSHPDARTIFERLRQEFDFVIIDTSPILPVTDGLLIAEHVDAVLFSVMRNVSRTPLVYAAHQRLASLGARMFGAIVTGESSPTYGGGRYEYSYQNTQHLTDRASVRGGDA